MDGQIAEVRARGRRRRLRGVTLEELRQELATQLSGVQSVLDGMLVDRPRRNILRRQPG